MFGNLDTEIAAVVQSLCLVCCFVLSPFSLQLERSFKFMREAEDQLKAIPQFCFPDAKDWTPVQQFTRYVLVSPRPPPALPRLK